MLVQSQYQVENNTTKQGSLVEDKILKKLSSIGQGHLIQNYDQFPESERKQFIQQVLNLEISYPGGIEAYMSKAKQLLKDSKDNVNPYEGFVPSVPVGETLDFKNKDQINKFESIGLNEIDKTCFVLVAGGLGERLGYQGIKVEIPINLLDQQCYLQYYCTYILALQNRCKEETIIPLAIMTSDDTYALTVKLLEDNDYFGMKKDQVTIMKQEKVPAIIDNEARFAQIKGKLEIETKPHGHGDVHQLIHQHGLHEKWASQGKKWVFFFQDTNALVFRSILAVLGISQEKNLEVNSITIPRKPGEAVGAICRLNHKDGRSLTLNIEYNQLEPLLNNTIGKEEVDQHGYSIFPGNINSLVFKLEEYSHILNETSGVISEFINPKYADNSKTKFKSATRLECMMQDYPKLLKNADRVGFTQIPREYCFAACKNDIASAAQKQQQGLSAECAGSCEEAFYNIHTNILKLCGAEIDCQDKKQAFKGISYAFGPKIIMHPNFGVTLQEIQNKIKGNIQITADSSLILGPNCQQINGLYLDGHTEINETQLEKVVVDNKQYIQFVEVEELEKEKQFIQIRGYKIGNEVE